MTWASQGIYSKHEYLERIFSDAVLGDSLNEDEVSAAVTEIYESISEYIPIPTIYLCPIFISN